MYRIREFFEDHGDKVMAVVLLALYRIREFFEDHGDKVMAVVLLASFFAILFFGLGTATLITFVAVMIVGGYLMIREETTLRRRRWRRR